MVDLAPLSPHRAQCRGLLLLAAFPAGDEDTSGPRQGSFCSHLTSTLDVPYPLFPPVVFFFFPLFFRHRPLLIRVGRTDHLFSLRNLTRRQDGLQATSRHTAIEVDVPFSPNTSPRRKPCRSTSPCVFCVASPTSPRCCARTGSVQPGSFFSPFFRCGRGLEVPFFRSAALSAPPHVPMQVFYGCDDNYNSLRRVAV